MYHAWPMTHVIQANWAWSFRQRLKWQDRYTYTQNDSDLDIMTTVARRAVDVNLCVLQLIKMDFLHNSWENFDYFSSICTISPKILAKIWKGNSKEMCTNSIKLETITTWSHEAACVPIKSGGVANKGKMCMIMGKNGHLVLSCHNPNSNDNTMQHNLNTVVGLDMKMTVQNRPPHHYHPTIPPHKLISSIHDPQINIYWPQLNIMWPVTTSRATTTTTPTSWG